MKTICSQIFDLLKPGGRFIFSVPHPFMLNAHLNDTDNVDSRTFSFVTGKNHSSKQYFSLRDRKFAGVIKRTDGCALNVKMCFKTLSDYMETIKHVGFDVSYMHEARVLPEHVSSNPEFFDSVKDSPLHVVFEVVKPLSKQLELHRIPRKILWTPFERQNANRFLDLRMPLDVTSELKNVVVDLIDDGFDVDTFSPSDAIMMRLKKVTKFAEKVRIRLKDVGAVFVNELCPKEYMDGLETLNLITRNKRMKFAYYIICSLVGQVDGDARGLLFDVIDHKLDTSSDNVLFSKSSDEASFHTDGASSDKTYDVASLLCISQSFRGGNLHITNASAAFNKLKDRLPKFILHELMRPLPRNILENGKGEGVTGSTMNIVRKSEELMKLRVHHNSYPIFVEADGGNRLEFRYMRPWIESGLQKAQLAMSPLLKVALDLLDGALQKEEITQRCMKPGEMVFMNNKVFAHAHDSFEDSPDEEARHKVRAWIQMEDLEDM